MDLIDSARFGVADREELVEASFCCQVCLRRPAIVIAGAEESGGGFAWCYCASCRSHTQVTLNADQILRLTLAPPIGARIHVIRAEDV